MPAAGYGGLRAQIPALWGEPLSDALKRGSHAFSSYPIHAGDCPNLWLALPFLKQLSHTSLYPEPLWVNWSPTY